MITELSAEAQAFLRRQVEAGKYASEVEVVEESLRVLAERDEYEATVAAVREGVADAEAGRVHTVKEVFDELYEKYPSLKSE
jgi:antitoxin ParD1/3/4